ncbi:MAG: CRISPR-associated protein Cas5 [Desulfobacterales bacterium]|nr:CRISPR-associated protein Cas5 [Desulfobacterales bacterium]
MSAVNVEKNNAVLRSAFRRESIFSGVRPYGGHLRRLESFAKPLLPIYLISWVQHHASFRDETSENRLSENVPAPDGVVGIIETHLGIHLTVSGDGVLSQGEGGERVESKSNGKARKVKTHWLKRCLSVGDGMIPSNVLREKAGVLHHILPGRIVSR